MSRGTVFYIQDNTMNFLLISGGEKNWLFVGLRQVGMKWRARHWNLSCKGLTNIYKILIEFVWNNFFISDYWIIVWKWFIQFARFTIIYNISNDTSHLLEIVTLQKFFWMDTPLHNNALFQCWIKLILYTNHPALSQSYILQWCIT